MSIDIQASDPDNDTLIFAATGMPAGLSINSSSGQISGSLTPSGVFEISVTATNTSGAYGETTFFWSITGVELLPFPASPVQEVTTVFYTALTTLPGLYNYSWDFGDGSPPIGPSNSPNASHTFTSPGRYIVTVTLDDPSVPLTDIHQFAQIIVARLRAPSAPRIPQETLQTCVSSPTPSGC